MAYSDESAPMSMRIPIALLERLDSQAHEFNITRSMLIRSILEMFFMTPDEIQSRLDKERAIVAWLKGGTGAKKGAA